MLKSDLIPTGVDALPERPFRIEGAMEVLPYRTGHMFDPEDRLQVFGVEKLDSSGTTWTVREDGDGVYKSKSTPTRTEH